MKVLRILLLWVLMLTLPIQGFAAALRSSCGTEQQSSHSVVQADDGAPAAHFSHHHDDADTDPVAMHEPHHEVAGTSHGHYQSHNQHHDHKNAFCGSCGSCCTGAFALMSTQLSPPAFQQVSVEVVAPSPLVTGFIPESLERPPRLLSL